VAGRIIDCCSLINLYTGWGGLVELADLKGPCYVSRSVCSEAEYVREYGAGESIITVALDLDDSFSSGRLSSLTAGHGRELSDYIDLAMELDDGEAESLALARNRDLVLVTDDLKALRMTAGLSVAVMSTAAVLMEWGGLNRSNNDRLPVVVSRIEELARFRPRSDSPDCAWWDSVKRAI
jgi:hypothetical protein